MRSGGRADGTVPADRSRPRGPVVLVGLSGAGKTVVGRLLAARLGWAFVDLDAEVERLANRSVAELFASGGEVLFRDLESHATLAAHISSATVVSTGGGWMSRPELRDRWPDAVRVWLRVEPAAAVVRLARDRTTRPLLAGPDPEAVLQELLTARLPDYRLAEVHVRTDSLEPAAVAEEIWKVIVERGPSSSAR